MFPTLSFIPIIVSGSEDGTVKIWNSGTYRIENTLIYALERACQWCVALRKDANEEAIGFDEDVVVIWVCVLFKTRSPKIIIPI